MKADILREKFLSFFKSRKHRIVESDSLVPKDDPTVLFTPAGMNQFKRKFLGHITDFSRAATSQRCLRTDDLDKVGHTSGHHTFFEMLGNFSFGDYFKKEAITWAWEFLITELKIDPHKLWVSVYQDDEEAYSIWSEVVKVPVEKIVRLGDKDNFWPSEAKTKGPNGPCGPCSEIFYDTSASSFASLRTSLSINPNREKVSRRIDFGSTVGCGKPDCSPACDCGRFVEIWNLVFTQFNRKENGSLESLPQKNIDTGMGLERLAAVMQGVGNNFETDLFQPMIKEIQQEVSLRGAGGDEAILKKQDCFGTSCLAMTRAIADHIRAVTFSIYDGIMPSNEARGYVVRKVIRKSLLHLRALGIEKPFLYKLVPVVCQIMRKPYPELEQRRENIAQIILAEENNFINTLNSSGSLLEEKFAKVMQTKDIRQAGQVAFQLYDTYGIPLELTKEWLGEHKISFSREAFDQALKAQKERSKSSSAMKGDVFSSNEITHGLKETKFVGFKDYETKAKIIMIIQGGKEVKKIAKGNNAEIILDKTCFYAESGGQAGDSGEFVKGKNIFSVVDTKKLGKAFVHIGQVKAGGFKKGDFLTAKVNQESRLATARNHTATHLLQAALRKVLGAHVQQQGSLVTAQKLRFDFTHFKGLSNDELNRVEALVNTYIMENHSLKVKEMALAAARKTRALAYFAEKYEGRVRVVSVGDFSKEFCGGTHLDATGQIGIFKIIREGSVASGIRRIEAVSGTYALKAEAEEKDALKAEIEKNIARIKELEKMLKSQKIGGVKDLADEAIKEAKIIKKIKVITKPLEQSFELTGMSSLMDTIKQKSAENTIIFLGANNANAGKSVWVLGVTSDLVQKGWDASGLIRDALKSIGGSGGGRKDFAKGGSNAFADIDKVFQALINRIGEAP